jgi:hypothetical protein
MPPQQGDGLLDVINGAGDFRTHFFLGVMAWVHSDSV